MRVFITGPTSFTGSEIVNTLLNAQHEVVSTFQREVGSYLDLKFQRIQNFIGHRSFRYIDNTPVKSPYFLDFIQECQADTFIFHHHYMEGWRSPDYDMVAMNEEIISPIANLVNTLVKANCHKIIYSGSIAEPMHSNSMASSFYAKSKQMVWEELLRNCDGKILLQKIVIPNPIGARENLDRMIPLMAKHIVEKKPLELKNPGFCTKNIPVKTLTKEYLKMLDDTTIVDVLTPTTWDSQVVNFCNVINQEIFEKRLGMNPVVLKYDPVQNPSAVSSEVPILSKDFYECFDQYASWLDSNWLLFK